MSETKQISVGGREFTLSPVPLIGLKKIGPRLGQIGKDLSEDAIDALTDAIFYGVKRNHPEVERDFFEWNIDATNMAELMDAFTAVNSVPNRGEEPAGEA